MPSIVSFYHMFVYYVNLWVIMKGGLWSKHVTDFGNIILYGKGNFETFTHACRNQSSHSNAASWAEFVTILNVIPLAGQNYLNVFGFAWYYCFTFFC